MRVLLIGYGKMGKMIESVLLEKGHTIGGILEKDTPPPYSFQADVAIEFTQPDAAPANIQLCLDKKLPIVVGTTGWYVHLDRIKQETQRKNGKLLYASNFSIGVNIFFELNKTLATLMKRQPYECSITEKHHTEKKDTPSGTAITLAQQIIQLHPYYQQWTKGQENVPHSLPVFSERIADEPGTHIIRYHNEIDEIVIHHKAFNRRGFATGAVMAAEWLIKQPPGVYTMSDVLNL